ncbi:WAT1-related protein [Pyrus ussuriensis x Pyrus communis]|uniref:WAT1-related protein n=1 Tax=Pyrus ussuriensis x Pyrus communis TaxID=2448454 RepID=A0A5N5GD00_9ROSA|nr:WAT1-related protein [Pyrus ussuriensis x Pyrus communis]
MEERLRDTAIEGNGRRERVIENSKPYILCIFSNICFAGFSVVSKVSLDKRHELLCACGLCTCFRNSGNCSSCPKFLEVNIVFILLVFSFMLQNESKISVPVLRNVFFLGFLGGVFGRTLNYMGLEYTSAAFGTAMSNLIPCITFIIAMEKFDIGKLGMKAKTGGTLVEYAGATLMTLYKGIAVISMHTEGSHRTTATSKPSIDRDWIKGSLVLLVSYFALSAFYSLQVTNHAYLTRLSGTLLTGIMTAILDHKASSWKLSWNITLLAPVYSEVKPFLQGVVIYLQTLVAKTRGPVFMTAFRPLATIVAAIMGLFILGEALYMGRSAFLIVLGLSATLWGKEKGETENRLQNQELLVLGQQTLTELKDKSDCLTDHVMQIAGQHDPSAYFLVEALGWITCHGPKTRLPFNTFVVDYSEPIFDWLKDSKDDALEKWESIVAGELKKKQKAVVGDVTGSQLSSFRAVDMDKTKFSDLKFRLGVGYLYCHQVQISVTIYVHAL